jgi:hypothetical protein
MANLKFMIILLFFLIFFSFPVLAKEIKTITLFGGFVDNAKKFDKSFTFPVPPDGISDIYYAKAKVRADMTGTSTNIYFYLNGSSCVPSYYSVSDKSWGYTMEFDCTNILKNLLPMTSEKIVSFTVDSNKNLQNIYIEWEITYLNNPKKPSVSIFGTEYYPNSYGKIFLQYLDINSQPINDGLCVFDMYSPNNTVLYNNEIMNFLENGIYYYDIKVPSEEGVYMISAECRSPTQKITYLAWKFENYTVVNESGDYTFTWSLDHYVHNLTWAGILLNSTYFFNSSEGIAQVDWYGGGYGNLILGFYNCTSKQYQNFPLFVVYPNNIYHVSRTIQKDFYCDNMTRISLRFLGSNVWTDYLALNVYNTSGVIQEVRGGGEVHVSNLAKFFDSFETSLVSNHDYCLDNTTLRKELIVQKCVDTLCYNITKFEDMVCNYGCDTERNTCLEPPFIRWGYIVGLFIAGIIIFLVIIRLAVFR